MTKHDQERRDALLRYIAKVELQITKEYGKTCQLIGQIHELRKAVESNDDFAWEKHPEIRNKMYVLLDRFARRTANTLTVAASTAYDMGLTDGTNKAVEAYSSIDKSKRKSVKNIARECLNEHRKGGKEAHAYATAKRGGLTISDRVWNLTKGTEKEIEICVQNAILQGGDAADLSREIRGYLNNPKALFRRVRNPKTGNLELSKAAQNYHPGQGVYRSAYLNAMRLTRTEINQAYRTAETASYADNPLITGYRIRLSDNHTTLFKGKRIPLVDICDYLAGEYPATFKWNGWHPQCRCIIVPNTLSEDDLDTLIQARGEAIKRGEDPNEVLPGFGRNESMPANFVEWYADNAQRIAMAKYRPIWATSGAYELRGDRYGIGYYAEDVSYKPTSIKDLSEIDEVIRNMALTNPKMFVRGFKRIIPVSNTKYMMETDMEGTIYVNFAANTQGFNAGEELLSAFKKIKAGQELSINEEYSIECLWHEIMHNQTKKVVNLPKIESANGFPRLVAETINQMVARDSYASFLSGLGGNAIHNDWIWENGYGYRVMVANVNKLLKAANIDRGVFLEKVKKHLLRNYETLEISVKKTLESLYKGKNRPKWHVSYCFDMIEYADFDDIVKSLL